MASKIETMSTHPTLPDAVDVLRVRYLDVRRASELLCRPLVTEDYGVQGMADTSPPKWHLAHTSWFFETFVLKPFMRGYRVFDEHFEFLFNSYYQTVGAQYPRAQRGLLSRPSVEEVYRYRAHVDEAMTTLLDRATDTREQIESRTAIGCHHEQQHQELLLTDIKFNFSLNPARPAYCAELPSKPVRKTPPLGWIEYPSGIREIGHTGLGFAFDNEMPRHRSYAGAFALASRLITCGEYLEFIEAGGYRRADYWLADGWRTTSEHGWQAPLYWERVDGRWSLFTLAGMRALSENEPVCHVSYYEADAFARWAGRRLPTEQEWEIAAAVEPVDGNLRESGYLHPVVAVPRQAPAQLFGDVWEWTGSAYLPYPGYRPPAGALGEYNGKFMINQMVLRGGSCVTPSDHIRSTYRNYFYPRDRWQFTGIRLADDR